MLGNALARLLQRIIPRTRRGIILQVDSPDKAGAALLLQRPGISKTDACPQVRERKEVAQTSKAEVCAALSPTAGP
jgi:hypothetical protein